MKYSTMLLIISCSILIGCASNPPRTQKYYYEMTLYLNSISKQTICSTTPMKESVNVRRIP